MDFITGIIGLTDRSGDPVVEATLVRGCPGKIVVNPRLRWSGHVRDLAVLTPSVDLKREGTNKFRDVTMNCASGQRNNAKHIRLYCVFWSFSTESL